ncbi:MAG: DUF502 domain-containing protein [Betaproteobacteria bacterium]|nr:DUF502 domain-containing protein [Betaproteobacteria bacterium]MBU6511987.1 DUF502 domain-containing protein [Betaproteobacteria bacterium]MDE1955297.1 DUF502 domain-containing protein [Betaproteobacteria bacterium]MDE2151480.1 DUF502 domain-containing protein [Betaproteobacteria bacterium]MDE2478230.1 DUF502 domain-containing protein [Betaproteobacteria bacterium]
MRLKNLFVAGLLVWLPLTITIWVLWQLLSVFDGIFRAVIGALDAVAPSLQPLLDNLARTPGLGVIVVVAAILLTGLLVANFVGQWWLRQWDSVIARIPIVKSIYSSVKQVSDTLFSSNGNAFRQAVMVQYPRAGSWTIAFVTGQPGGEVARHLPGEHISVYVPTTPNPTSGFFLMVPRAEVVELSMSVDEALKYVISMGVVAPLPPSAQAPSR